MAAFVQRAAASQAVKDGCFDHLDVAYVQSLIRETDNDNSVKETNLHKPKAGENLVIRVDNKKGTSRMAHGGRSEPDLQICVLGHSYVERVLAYTRQDRLLSPGECFTLHGRVVRVQESSQRGASVIPSHSPKSASVLAREALRLMPMPVVFFCHIGECDVADRGGRASLSPDLIVRHIIDLVRFLLSAGVRYVVVGQLLFWPLQGHREAVQMVNYLLVDAVAGLPQDRVMYWRHRGFWNDNRNLFHRDGVHLSREGNHRYWESIREAVSICIRHSLNPTPVLQPAMRQRRRR